MENEKSKDQPKQRDYCKGCHNFYGDPNFEDMCSKCYK